MLIVLKQVKMKLIVLRTDHLIRISSVGFQPEEVGSALSATKTNYTKVNCFEGLYIDLCIYKYNLLNHHCFVKRIHTWRLVKYCTRNCTLLVLPVIQAAITKQSTLPWSLREGRSEYVAIPSEPHHFSALYYDYWGSHEIPNQKCNQE